MKTNSAPILLAAAFLAGAAFCSCSTTGGPPGHTAGNPASGPGVQEPITKHWVKVADKPPTWYPRGVAADAPTDPRNGEWVCTRDARDTRFFIPLRGMPQARRAALVREAMAMRDERAWKTFEQQLRRQMVKERAGDYAKNASIGLLMSPYMVVLGAWDVLAPGGIL